MTIDCDVAAFDVTSMLRKFIPREHLKPIEEYWNREVCYFLNDCINGLPDRNYLIRRESERRLIEDLFKYADNVYYGITILPPAEFMVQNGSYLEAHQILCQKAKKNNGPIHENSQRYMYISRAEFKNSLTRNHTYAINIALDFLYWHAINGVDLYRIDKTTADEIFKNRDLPVSDIGLWKNKFAVFFYKPAYPERTHKMNGHYSWKERYINIVFNVEGRDSREYSTLHNIEDAYRCLERHVKSNKKDIIISADNYKGMSGEDRIKDKVKNEIKDLLKYL